MHKCQAKGFIAYDDLLQRNGTIRFLFIHSYQADIYLAEIETVFGERLMVLGNDKRPISFRGKLKALKAFSGLNIKDSYLVYQTACSEMIGLPQEPIEPLVLRLKSPDDVWMPVDQ